MSTEKYAQRRSVVRQVGRALNPMEHARRYLSDEYSQMTEEIKAIDTSMREKALGQNDELREYLHEARMAMKQRKFPSVVYYAYKLVSSIDGVFDEVSKLNHLKDEYLEQQYGKSDLLPSQMQELDQGLSKSQPLKSSVRFPKAAAMKMLLYAAATPDEALYTKADLISQAGPVQWIKENIPSFEGMKVDLMDRVFRNKTHKQREAARQAMRIAERAYSSITSVFEKLDQNLTDFSSYIDQANKAKNMFDTEAATLSQLYQDHFSHLKPEEVSKTLVEEDQPQKEQEEKSEEGDIEVDLDEMIEVQPDLVPEQYPAQQQMTFDFDQPQTPEELEQQHVAASEVLDLVERSKISLASGQRGIAIALLARASEICDNYGAEESSTSFLEIAQSLAK